MKTFAALFAVVSLFALVSAQFDDYVLDTKWLSEDFGRVSLPPMPIGGGEIYTIEMLVHARGDGCLLDMGDTNNRLTLEKSGNELIVYIADSTASGTMTLDPDIWYQISLVIYNLERTASAFYTPLTDGSGSVNTIFEELPITNMRFVTRSGFVGTCMARTETGFVKHFDGQFDDLKFWAKEKIPSQAGTHLDDYMEKMNAPGLIIQYPMNDAQFDVTFGIPGPAARFDTQLVANLVGPIEFVTKTALSSRVCSGSGDPHFRDKDSARFDTPHIDQTYFILQQCDEGQLTVKLHHMTGCCWSSKTVIDEVLIESFNDRVKMNRAGEVLLEIDDNWVSVSETNKLLSGGSYFTQSDDYMKFVAPMGGYVKINNYGRHMRVQMEISEACHSSSSYSICEGHRDPSLSYYEFELPSDPTSESLPSSWFPSEWSEPTDDPCDDITQDFIDQAQKMCEIQAYDPVTDQIVEEDFHDCMFDACATGILEPPCEGNNCPNCQWYLTQASVDNSISVPDECIPVCPDDCSGRGPCNEVTGECVCNDGWTGVACDTPKEWNCFTVTAPEHDAITLYPYDLADSLNFPRGIDNPTIDDYFDWVDLHAFYIRDSLLFMTTEQLVGDTRVSAIIITANHPSSRTTGSITITVSGKPDVVTVPAVCTLLDTSQCVSPSSYSDGTLTLSWNPFSSTGAVILNPPGEISFTISGFSGQVLAGSYFKNGRLDIVKFDSNTVTLDVGVCTDNDECAIIDDCSECAANPKCGWCRDNERCMVGNAMGPSRRQLCANWRYSFDDSISRRVTTSFAWPVSPEHEEVFLTDAVASADLPVEVLVDVGNTETTPWDLIWAISAREVDLDQKNMLSGHASEIYNAMTYRSVAWGLSTYGWATDGTTSQRKLVRPIVNKKPSLSEFKGNLSSLALYPDIGTATLGAQLEVLSYLADPEVSTGWHDFTKRTIILNADSDFSTATVSVDQVRQSLLDANIIPVFAATPSFFSTYENLVESFGFGIVIEMADNAENMASVINTALTRVIGNIFLQVEESDLGYIDPDYNRYEMQIHGLTSGMRARFILPVDPRTEDEVKTSTVVVPGYGKAVIENILSDKPWTTGQRSLTTLENYDSSVYGVEGVMIHLSGKALHDLPEKVLIYITGLPELGTIYQFTESDPSNLVEITESDLPALVHDGMGRVVFLPDPDVWCPATSPCDFVHYVVNDFCVDSEPGLVALYIHGVNEPPVVGVEEPFGYEDTPVVITFTHTDEDSDKVKYVITKLPNEATPSGLKGKLYQYTEDVANGNLDNAVEILLEDSVPADETSGEGKAVYIPPPNANTQGLPSPLKIYPELSFKAVETECCEGFAPDQDILLESVEMDVPIWIESINDPPTVWESLSNKRMKYEEEGTICYRDCTFKEDFGYPLGYDFEPVLIFGGGHDIEGSILTLRVTSVDCPTGSLTTIDGNNVQVGTEVTGLFPDMLTPVFLFKPLLDTYGEDYCVIKYLLDDFEDVSVDTWTITIDVTPVNDVPRLLQQRISTYEDTAIDFSLAVSDVDMETSGSISATFSSCGASEGSLYALIDESEVLIDCSDLSSAPVLQSDVSPVEWSMRFVPPAGRAKLQMMTVDLLLADEIDSSVYMLIIDVYAINNGPVVALDNEQGDLDWTSNFELNMTVEPSTLVPLPFFVNDSDVGSNLLAVEMTTTLGTLSYTLSNDVQENLVDYVVSEDGQTISFKLPLAMLNKFIHTLSFTSETEGLAEIHIVISDQGFVGSCPPNEDGTPGDADCPLEAEITLFVKVKSIDNFNTAVVGGASAVGALMGIGAAAALFKLFRTPPKDADWHPWQSPDAADGTTENPLYQAKDNEGTNPLYNQ